MIVAPESDAPKFVDISQFSGLEALSHVFDASGANRPPVARLLDINMVELASGRVVFGFTPSEAHRNGLGQVHGGVVSTVLDSAMGCAVHSTLPVGAGYTTLELKVNFVRAVRADGHRTVTEGKVVHRGRRIVTAEGRMMLEDGTLLAHGTSTCLVTHG